MQTDYDTGQDVRAKTEETVSTLVDQVQQVAETKATTQKERAAETLGSVAQSIRDAGSGMRDQQPQIASFAEQAAGRVEEVSTYIREHDVQDLVGEAERLARREPLLFLGGALAIGFVAARFLKASAPQGSSNAYAGDGSYRYGSTGSNGSNGSYNAYGAQPTGSLDTGYSRELTSGGSMYGAGGQTPAAEETGGSDGWSGDGAGATDQSSGSESNSWAQGGSQSGYGSEDQGDDRTGRE